MLSSIVYRLSSIVYCPSSTVWVLVHAGTVDNQGQHEGVIQD